MRAFTIVLQITLLCGVSMLGNELTSYFHLNIPGNILGLILLYFLLQCKIVSVKWVEHGADFLIAELLLFFIPSAIGVMQFQSALINQFFNMGAVIVLSTIAVVLFVGLITEGILNFHRKEREHDSIV